MWLEYIWDCNLNTDLKQFQGVPRRVLDHLLPSGSATFSSAPKPKPKAETITQVVTEKLHVQVENTDGNVVPKVVTQTVNKVSIGSNLVARAFEIIAEEIGLAASELVPNSTFVDLGVDSLLSLTITSRLREELELDVSSTLFAECLSVQELTGFLRRGEGTVASSQSTSGDQTPGTRSESSGYQTDQTNPSSEDLGDVDVMATMRCILAEEIGISVHELKGSSDFGELGLDSLLSLTVLARLREEVNLHLPGSLFLDKNSLDEVESFLGLKGEPMVTIKEINPSSNNSVSSSIVHLLPEAVDHHSDPIAGIKEMMTITPSPAVNIRVSRSSLGSSVPKASSMLLQGSTKVATKCLFLFPDGSGSATSYAPLPSISSDVVVYGLNCPYIRSPHEMKCSLEELTPPYLAEIRRRQPHGPYYLGGWSAGGICAFDAAQELERCGETVARLILIDSPFPIGLEKLPPRLYDFFSSIGMFGSAEGKAPPSWLIPHFLAFVDALDRYRARPFALGRGPKTFIVWAKDGVCKNPGDPRPEPRADDPREMNWLLNNRTDFGPNGWDTLLGCGGDGEDDGNDDEKVVVETIEDANHFSLMEGEKVKELARFLERAMI